MREKKDLSPITIGAEVLRNQGYDVEIAGIGYSGLEIIVKKEGEVLLREVIGE